MWWPLLFLSLVVGCTFAITVSKQRDSTLASALVSKQRLNLADLANLKLAGLLPEHLWIHPSLMLQHDANWGWGLYPNQAVLKGEVLLRVALRNSNGTVFSRASLVARHPQWSQFLENLEARKEYAEHLFGYFLAWEYIHSKEDHPAFFTLPVNCSDGTDFLAELERCMPPETHKQLTDFLVEVQRERWEEVKALAPPGREVSHSDYLWGVCCTRTRNFASRVEDLGTYLTVPFADLFNHDSENVNVDYELDAENTSMIFKTTRDVAAGEQCTTVYGCKTRLDLLRTYGFVPGTSFHLLHGNCAL
jgi:hypothetical protein